MHKKIILLVSLFSIVSLSCKKHPTACIEMSETDITAGSTVEFSSCSENSLSLSWTFEGPAGAPENTEASSDIKFSKTFNTPGVFKVRLYAYKEFSFMGEVSIALEEIRVN